MTSAAVRFLSEVEVGAWSDSPAPWTATAETGLADVDIECITAYAEEAGESPATACEDVLAYVRDKVAADRHAAR